MRRFILPVFFAAAAAAGCEQGSTTPPANAEASRLPADQVVYGLEHHMTRNGVRTATLAGDTAYLYDNGDRFEITGVHLKFFAENGRETGDLTSREGEYEVSEGVFIAKGDVVLVTQGPNGTRRLETEELHYRVQGDELWSDKPFVMHEGGRTTRGNSFRSNASGSEWTATGLRAEGVETGGSELSF
jgi:LPS export ABC transporter protein LptC